MFKVIPRHSLVIVVGPNQLHRDSLVTFTFTEHEVISPPKVCYDLVGETNRPDLNSIIFAEIRRKIGVKLDLGERVVVNAANLKRDDRAALAQLGTDTGVPVFYLVCDPEGADPLSMSRFQATERDLMRGDGLAEVIDWRVHTPRPVPKEKFDLEGLRSRFEGITVVGDVHGMYQSLLSAVSWARSRRHYLVFLGDIVDYGVQTLECADEVYKIVMRNEGELILGNHERKIFRWANQLDRHRETMRLSEGNKVTTDALNGLGLLARKRWIGRFRGLVSHAAPFRVFGDVVLAHAAMHPGFWDGTASLRDLENWALTGEYDLPTKPGARPIPRYDWTQAIPVGKTVVVGHNIRSVRSPIVYEAAGAGKAVFLDTGSGKGGLLSSSDLRFDENGLHIENYNVY